MRLTAALKASPPCCCWRWWYRLLLNGYKQHLHKTITHSSQYFRLTVEWWTWCGPWGLGMDLRWHLRKLASFILFTRWESILGRVSNNHLTWNLAWPVDLLPWIVICYELVKNSAKNSTWGCHDETALLKLANVPHSGHLFPALCPTWQASNMCTAAQHHFFQDISAESQREGETRLASSCQKHSRSRSKSVTRYNQCQQFLQWRTCHNCLVQQSYTLGDASKYLTYWSRSYQEDSYETILLWIFWQANSDLGRLWLVSRWTQYLWRWKCNEGFNSLEDFKS